MVETALSWIGGRAVLNSVNLEEGDEPGTRLDSFLTLARSTAPPWCAPASTPRARPGRPTGRCGPPRAIHDIAVERYGLEPEDLIFDALALPLSTGMEESRQRRHRDHRGHPAHQGRAARGLHHRSACPTSRSGSTPRPATCSTRCSSTSASRPGSTRPSSTRPRSCRCRRSTTGPARCASTWSTTAGARATTRCPSCWPCSRGCRPRPAASKEDRSGLARRAAARATHHRRRPQRHRGRPRRGHGRRRDTRSSSSTTSSWPA